MRIRLRYFISLMAFLFLTACGGTINTNISFNDVFSGSRVMTYTVSNADYTSYVLGDLDTLTRTLRALCPEGIEISSVNQDESNITAVFTISFTSLEDYKNKITQIIAANGGDITPEVTFFEPDSVFAKGMIYQENFASEDLLSWMKNGITDNGYVSSSYTSYIFSSNYVTLNFNGVEYAKDLSMNIADVNSVVYLPIDNVDFTTALNNDGSIDRKISVVMPLSTYNKSKAEIEEFLASRVTADASGSWMDIDGDKVFVIEEKNMSIEQCTEMTDLFTGGTDSFKLLTDDREEKAAAESGESTVADDKPEVSEKTEKGDQFIFYKNYLVEETVNLEDYISNDDGSVDFRYNINSQNSCTGTVSDASGRKNEFAATAVKSDKDIMEVYRGYSSSFDIKIDISISPRLSEYKHTVKVTPGGNVKRDIRLVFADSFNEEDVTVLETRLKAAFEKKDVKLDKISLKGKKLKVRISSNTKPGEDSRMWYEIFGYNMENVVKMDKKGLLPAKQVIYFYDYFTPTVFTSGTIDSYEYKVAGIGKPINKDAPQFETDFEYVKGEFKGGSFTAEGKNIQAGDYGGVAFRTVRTNYAVYAIYLVFALSAAFLIFRLIVTLLSVIKEKAEMRPILNSAGDMEAGNDKFCPYCGIKKHIGDRFCSNCGKEI